MKFNIGSLVRIKTSNTEYEGIVLPSSTKEILFLKLRNGYNAGFSIKSLKSLKEIVDISYEKKQAKVQKQNPKLPKVAIITTGGTIASKIDYKTGAVAPLTKPEELLSSLPELKKKINVSKIISPVSIFSEDMTYKEWQKIAIFIAKELNEGNVGAIVAHGTDTLHYTAAALTFMLEDLSKPVALVGSQRSSDRGSFDGAENILCAAEYAKSDIAEVSVIMHASSSDNKCFALPATKARKMHTSRRDAFRPINAFPYAEISPDGKINPLINFNKRTNKKVKADTRFEPKIALIKIHPSISADILDFYISKGYQGIIIEGTGLGHLPLRFFEKNKPWVQALKRAKQHDIVVCMTSQCLYGRVDPFVYDSGRLLKELDVIYLEDMLPETAFVKLGCLLGRFKNHKKVRELMPKNWKGELNSKLAANQFLY